MGSHFKCEVICFIIELYKSIRWGSSNQLNVFYLLLLSHTHTPAIFQKGISKNGLTQTSRHDESIKNQNRVSTDARLLIHFNVSFSSPVSGIVQSIKLQRHANPLPTRCFHKSLVERIILFVIVNQWFDNCS